MKLSSKQLNGLDYRKAELMGKPHINAHYANRRVKSNMLDGYAPCCVCGQLATNSHHVVPLSVCHFWKMNTPRGVFSLSTPLFALCGSGTTGCHNGFHGGARYSVEWVWVSEQYRDEWWEGHTLANICRQHDSFLWQQGYYELTDKVSGRVFRLRG